MTVPNGVESEVPSVDSFPKVVGKQNGSAVEYDPYAIALSPCALEVVPDLVGAIASYKEGVSEGNRAGRLNLLAAARSLPAALMAMAVGVNIGLFSLLAEEGEKPKKAANLAVRTGVDPALLCRLMRHLATMGVITETGQDEYRPTNFSTSLTIPIIGDGYPCIAGGCLDALAKFPEYLVKTGYRTPDNDTDGPYQYAYHTSLNFFAYLQAHPTLGIQFNHHMGGYRQGRPSWMDPDFYPVDKLLVNSADRDPNAVLLVDMGGNLGHDLEEFQKKHPNAPGRLILQDLPVVIGQIKSLHAKVEPMVHDFFTEQPIKGARAYYMHSVLHDWPDSTCLRILSHVKAAMKSGYSKLLINENVIPDVGADWQATGLDLMVMTLLSSRERTSKDWHRLLEQAGLKILNVWSVENGVESLIECELA